MAAFKTCLSIIEWTLFFGLCGMSIAFIWQALVQYQSKDSTFKRSEVHVKEFPSIIVCPYSRFSGVPPPYVLGQNLTISYFDGYSWLNLTNLEKTYNEKLTETIDVNLLVTWFSCFKITATSSTIKGSRRGIKFIFNQSLPNEDLPHELNIYLASEHNSYSALFDKFMNGKAVKHVTKMGQDVEIGIKAEKFTYLEEKSGCSHKSFWELWEPEYSNHPSFEECPKKCAAITLPNNSTPICETLEEFVCAYSNIMKAFNDYIFKEYPKTCTILQYTGEVEIDKQNLPPYEVQFLYNFAPPKTTTLHEEYLIYDAIGLLGSIGGTLGMCIGFSFSSVLNSLLTVISSIKDRCH